MKRFTLGVNIFVAATHFLMTWLDLVIESASD